MIAQRSRACQLRLLPYCRVRFCRSVATETGPTRTPTPSPTPPSLGLLGVQIFPNPSSDGGAGFRCAFTVSPTRLRIRVYSQSGRKVGSWDEDFPSGGPILERRLDLNLANGVYSYVVEAEGPAGDSQRTRGRYFVLR